MRGNSALMKKCSQADGWNYGVLGLATAVFCPGQLDPLLIQGYQNGLSCRLFCSGKDSMQKERRGTEKVTERSRASKSCVLGKNLN